MSSADTSSPVPQEEPDGHEGLESVSSHYTEDDVRAAADAFWGLEDGRPGQSIRAMLDAVAPAIAARALRDAAQQILDGYTCDPEVTPREGDLECIAFDDAIQHLRATADEIEPDHA